MNMSKKERNAFPSPEGARAAFPGDLSLPESEKSALGSLITASRRDRLFFATAPTLGEDEQPPCTSSSVGRWNENTAKAQADSRSGPSSTPS